MRRRLRRLEVAIRGWWECRTKRCSYYTHYQVYGPCELSHVGWHNAEKAGLAHFESCRHTWGTAPCSTCLNWERRLRA
jgi:hypothetical protein